MVAAEPGTTRDAVEARVVWDGVPVTLVDTAGDRTAGSDADQGLVTEIERRGVALGRARASRADVVVRVNEVGGVSTNPDAPGALDKSDLAAMPRVVEVWNKVDLAPAPAGGLGISAKTGAGLDALRQAILARVLGDSAESTDSGDEVIVATERQRRLLDEAATAAVAAADAARDGRPSEIIAADLRVVAARLGGITGQNVGEDMLSALFGRFCLGK